TSVGNGAYLAIYGWYGNSTLGDSSTLVLRGYYDTVNRGYKHPPYLYCGGKPVPGQSRYSISGLSPPPQPHVKEHPHHRPTFLGRPVVLALDGNGVDVVPLTASTAAFDMNGDGQRDRTAWAGPHDGLLAIDLGADGEGGPDGMIDQTKEIVFTEWAPGTGSDMAALRQAFDTNHDGKLDAAD